jgi:hypothetical protein
MKKINKLKNENKAIIKKKTNGPIQLISTKLKRLNIFKNNINFRENMINGWIYNFFITTKLILIYYLFKPDN